MRINLATRLKTAVTTYAGSSSTIQLDCLNKRIYQINYDNEGNVSNIYSTGYDGKNQTNITSGSFNIYLLGVSNGSLYFQGNDLSHINEMDSSSRNLSRKIQVGLTGYVNLITVESSLQPGGE